MTCKRLIPLLVGAACALSAAPAAASAATAVEQSSSENWSGYVVGGSGQKYKSVTASWVQPTAKCTSGSAQYSAFWVGLGGAGTTQALEQAGTEANCSSSGQASYYAWYELVPKAPVRVGLSVSPGDHITTTVSVSGGTVDIALQNTTTGQSVNKTLAMSNPDVSSAEWIAEAPSACDATVTQCTPLPLTDFGTVNFTGARATTTDGHVGSISDARWSTAAVTLGSSGSAGPGAQFTSYDSGASASPSSLSSDGSGFSVTYGSSGASSTQTSGDGSGYGGGSSYGGGSGYGSGSGDGYGGGSGYGYGGGSGYGGAGYGYGGYGGASSYGYGDGTYGDGATVYVVPGY